MKNRNNVEADDFRNSELEFKEINSKSRVELIVERISTTLLEENVEASTKIPSEGELMEQFNVSRGTLRQALQVLVYIGVLTSIPGKGYFISQGYDIPLKTKDLKEYLLTDRSFFNTLEARRMIEENVVIKLAAKSATKGDFKVLDDLLDELKKKTTLTKKLHAAKQVHLQIAKCTRNDTLVAIMDQLLTKVVGIAEEIQLETVAPYQSHKDLVEKLKIGDLNRLDQAVDEHLKFVKKEFMENLTGKEKYGYPS